MLLSFFVTRLTDCLIVASKHSNSLVILDIRIYVVFNMYRHNVLFQTHDLTTCFSCIAVDQT